MIVCTTQEKMVLLSNRSILTRGRAPQPISCKDSGFLRIMDALYALSDSYLHFPQEYMSERGGDLVYRKNRRNGMLLCRERGNTDTESFYSLL